MVKIWPLFFVAVGVVVFSSIFVASEFLATFLSRFNRFGPHWLFITEFGSIIQTSLFTAAEGHSDGNIVVEDCLSLVLVLLSDNSSNQTYFREARFRICRMKKIMKSVMG